MYLIIIKDTIPGIPIVETTAKDIGLTATFKLKAATRMLKLYIIVKAYIILLNALSISFMWSPI